MTDNNDLDSLRRGIDAIDEQLVELLNRRVALATEVGNRKRAAGDAVIYRPEREARILNRVRELSHGAIGDDALLLIFREIISACRGAESATRVAVLGPEGTYSQAASVKHFGHQIESVFAVSIEEVFRLVEAGDAEYGVVPVENSIEGGIGNTLDALFESAVTICGEINLPIRHALLSNSPASGDIREVLAHARALAQCRRWLAAHLPGAVLRPVSSNAEAARMAAGDPSRAAIAGEAVGAMYGLAVLERGIQDMAGNTTRFLVISTTPVPASGADKTSIVLSTRNRPGALFDLLQPLARHGVDMTRIESRPARQGLWEYLFYVDVAGHTSDDPVTVALSELERNAALFKVLGSYPQAVD
ncbi:MAG: prephenate dehydratase [Gammaproteobacteria bacterium]|nr:prephenate dehydratase [Gammaproteobacteria bacterium]